MNLIELSAPLMARGAGAAVATNAILRKVACQITLSGCYVKNIPMLDRNYTSIIEK